ncbi:hypothetical protein TSAR_000614 [Trichomalopsis sarcophagae]|uniref:Uncharacterized protein n=1 Tax=Trichomalopsis sarcophagae TaxID=543379 RepID=A0A232F9R2_9HYME|nr:hypothetical protein TSAR_000614 [Trichomalopsis sarcophagae]
MFNVTFVVGYCYAWKIMRDFVDIFIFHKKIKVFPILKLSRYLCIIKRHPYEYFGLDPVVYSEG